MVRRIGFRASAAPIRTGFARPAGTLARGLKNAPRFLHARASTEVRIHAVLT